MALCHYSQYSTWGDHPAAIKKDGTPVMDHIVPQARGGTDDPSNLVPSCTIHNSWKGDMPYDEFVALIPVWEEIRQQEGVYKELGLLVTERNEIQEARKRYNNRLKALERDGFQLSDERYEALREWKRKEDQLDRQIIKFVENELPQFKALLDERRGISAKTVGLVLAATGDPTKRSRDEFRAYSGVAPGQRREKGKKSNYNPKVKSIIVGNPALLGMDSSYRPMYDYYRAKYDAKVDKGAHALARRVVVRAVVDDIWHAAHGRVRSLPDYSEVSAA